MYITVLFAMEIYTLLNCKSGHLEGDKSHRIVRSFNFSTPDFILIHLHSRIAPTDMIMAYVEVTFRYTIVISCVWLSTLTVANTSSYLICYADGDLCTFCCASRMHCINIKFFCVSVTMSQGSFPKLCK